MEFMESPGKHRALAAREIPNSGQSTQVMNFDRIEKGEIVKVFKDFIFLQRDLETAKIELSLKPDFNLV